MGLSVFFRFLNQLSNDGLSIWRDDRGLWWYKLSSEGEPDGGYWGLGECLRAVLFAYIRAA